MNEMFVAHLYTQVKQAHEDIQQLTASKNTLTEVKGELEGAKEKVKEPELTSATWSGSLAVGFEDIRTAMLDEYDDLLTRQLTDVIAPIDAKITVLQSDIQGMERAIKKKVQLRVLKA
ncbi:YwqH-like family protein [Priestia megaterium]|uniref:YwqH-like family protein n=1 Tax=Priestia megaterium TaxID=1404 RepID=UPI00406BAA84